MTKKKTTALATENTDAQVQQIIDWIIAGHSMFDINEAIAAKITGDQRKKEKLMTAVLEYFRNSGTADAATIKGWALESMRELYRKMLESGDFAGAASLVKSIYNLHR